MPREVVLVGIVSTSTNCEHVYKRLGPGPCPKCGYPTHDINWEEHNEQIKFYGIRSI